MKKILFAAIMFTAVITAASAQDIPSRSSDSVKHEKKGKKAFGIDLSKELSFTSEQEGQWAAIRKETNKKFRTNDNSSALKEQKKEESDRIMKEQERQLQAILTPEQSARLHELRLQREEKRKSRNRG